MTQTHFHRTNKTRSDVTLASPVFARLQGQLGHHFSAPHLFLRTTRRAHAIEEVIEACEFIRNPCCALLSKYKLQIRVTLKGSTKNQLVKRAVCVPRHLKQERDGVFGVGTHRRCGRTSVMVHRHPEFLACLPNRFITRVVELIETATWWCSGKQHATGKAMFMSPANFFHRIFNVEQVDLHHSGAATGIVVTEVRKPAVVCLKSGPTTIGIGLRHRRRLRSQRCLRIERRNGVGVNDFCGLAIGFEIGHTTRGVPIASTKIAFKIFVRIFVLGRPHVELFVPLRLEIRAIVRNISPSMPIGRNNDVPLVVAQRCPLEFHTGHRRE